MVCAGIRFDDGSLDWDDLYAFIFAAPPGTAVFHAIEKGWTVTDHLLANAIDALAVANWQRTSDATKRPPRNAPKPFPRPGDGVDRETGSPQVGDVVSVGSNALATVTTVGEFLTKRAERERLWRLKHGGGDG